MSYPNLFFGYQKSKMMQRIIAPQVPKIYNLASLRVALCILLAALRVMSATLHIIHILYFEVKTYFNYTMQTIYYIFPKWQWQP